jgi:pimeloyl-ACP methyl ester carboxylesterase
MAIPPSRRAALDHVNYSKRAMAQDTVGVMRSLGFPRFAIIGHDGGGRDVSGLSALLQRSRHAARSARSMT